MALAQSWHEIRIVFKNMRIQYPRLDAAHIIFDDLRRSRSDVQGEQDFVTCFAPSQAGKSTIVRSYIEKRVVPDCIERGLFAPDTAIKTIIANQHLVLHVTLNDKASKRSVASDILTALGDPTPTTGSGDTLLQRAYDLCRKMGVELIVLDEVQHLQGKTPRDMSEGSSASNTLKVMLIRGLVPFVFMGTEAASALLEDKQFSFREAGSLNISKFDSANVEDYQTFRNYCGKTGILLQERGLFEERSSFVSDFIVDCIFEVSGGLLGIASRLIMHAAKRAWEEKVRQVTVDHLEYATDFWAIRKLALLNRNPFREKPLRQLTPPAHQIRVREA
jgi:hypothetical protein